VFFPGHEFYKGEMAKGQPHGEGEYHYGDGMCYKGSWQYGKKHGRGIVKGFQFELGSGFRYELAGSWVDNVLDEGCAVTHAHERHGVYRGQLLNGQRHGLGEFTFRNGDIFAGNFAKGHKSNGLYRYVNGDTYEGRFHMGRRVGIGSYRVASTGILVAGKFNGDSVLNAVVTQNGRLLFEGDCYLSEQLFEGKLQVTPDCHFTGRLTSAGLVNGTLSKGCAELQVHRPISQSV
jgi:hypothetical protein